MTFLPSWTNLQVPARTNDNYFCPKYGSTPPYIILASPLLPVKILSSLRRVHQCYSVWSGISAVEGFKLSKAKKKCCDYVVNRSPLFVISARDNRGNLQVDSTNPMCQSQWFITKRFLAGIKFNEQQTWCKILPYAMLMHELHRIIRENGMTFGTGGPGQVPLLPVDKFCMMFSFLRPTCTTAA